MIRKTVKTMPHSYQDYFNFDYLGQLSKTKALVKNDLMNHATKLLYLYNLVIQSNH